MFTLSIYYILNEEAIPEISHTVTMINYPEDLSLLEYKLIKDPTVKDLLCFKPQRSCLNVFCPIS